MQDEQGSALAPNGVTRRWRLSRRQMVGCYHRGGEHGEWMSAHFDIGATTRKVLSVYTRLELAR